MQKILLVAGLLLLTQTMAHAAVICPTQRPTCVGDEILECQTTQGVMPSGDVRGNWLCQDPDNWQPPPPTLTGGGQGNNIKKEAEKCADGKAPVNGKCPDCMETLELPTTRPAYIPPTQEPQRAVAGSTWLNMLYRSGLPQPTTQPEQARPAAAGPSIGGFAGILPGGPKCTWKESAEGEIFKTCVAGLVKERGPLTDPDLYGAYWQSIYNKCGRTEKYPAPGKWDCKNTASVFDALWGFLTHRKPY